MSVNIIDTPAAERRLLARCERVERRARILTILETCSPKEKDLFLVKRKRVDRDAERILSLQGSQIGTHHSGPARIEPVLRGAAGVLPTTVPNLLTTVEIAEQNISDQNRVEVHDSSIRISSGVTPKALGSLWCKVKQTRA